MRILMLVQHPGVRSPVPKHTTHLVAGLRALGCEVVTHPWGREEEREPLARKLVRGLRDVLSVRRELTRADYDAVVIKTSHDWRTLTRDVALAATIRRRPGLLVAQLHGSRSSWLVAPGRRLFKLATRALCALVDGIFVLSTEEQRHWQSFSRRPAVLVVKNPYVSAFDSEPVRETSDSDGHALFVGRLMVEKGIFQAVEALPIVRAQTPCDLTLVGEGEEEPALRARVRELGLESSVQIPGYLSGDDLLAKYGAATVFVLPTSWDEGFPTVIAEALDAGLPIVTTRIRGIADYLVEGENALFVEPGDVGALADAMISLLLDSGLRARMRSANRGLIRVFAPATVAREYLDGLLSLEARPRSGRRGHP